VTAGASEKGNLETARLGPKRKEREGKRKDREAFGDNKYARVSPKLIGKGTSGHEKY